jgi:hypothetical protein
MYSTHSELSIFSIIYELKQKSSLLTVNPKTPPKKPLFFNKNPKKMATRLGFTRG